MQGRPVAVFTDFFASDHPEDDIFFTIIIPITDQDTSTRCPVYGLAIGVNASSFVEYGLKGSTLIQKEKQPSPPIRD
jgi:hypothetical protein